MKAAYAAVDETCLFLNLHGEQLFVVHHAPVRPASRAVVICHPLGEEKLWAHRVLVSFARDLAAKGFAVLRFDFRGEGDSARAFEHSDLDTRVQDTCFAIDWVREQHPTTRDVTLVGLRLGASIAAAAAATRDDVSRLILWDPVVDGSNYMQAVLRLNLMYQMALHRKVVENRDALAARLAKGETVNIEGYELPGALFRQVSAFRLSDILPAFGGPTLVIQIGPPDTPIKPELVELARGGSHCSLALAGEEPFWKEIKTFCQRAPELTRISLLALEPDA